MNRILLTALRKVVSFTIDPSQIDPAKASELIMESWGEDYDLDENDIKQAVDVFNKMSDPIPIYRGVCLQSTDDLDRENLGAFWTYDKSSAFCRGSTKRQNEYIIEARIKKEDVLWDQTMPRHFSNWDEHEIIPREDATIMVDNILDSDGKSLGISFTGSSGRSMKYPYGVKGREL